MTGYPSTISSTATIPPEFPENAMAMEAIKRGYLSVRGTGMTSWLWSKRLVMLKNTCVTIHKQQNEDKALETLFFEEIRDLERCSSRTYCVKVATELRTLFISFKSDDEMWSWMDAIYKRSPMKGVSNPTNFNHTAHISFDDSTGMITTLDSNITAPQLSKNTLLENPEILQDLLEMYQENNPDYGNNPKHYSALVPKTGDLLKAGYRMSVPLNPFDLPEIPRLSVFDDLEFFMAQTSY
ncbi:Protein kinase [Basidiobolus ranarum]|uniref:Protein kinase n=1 Tax=Basidiobolus ranarum TaxID=34480 RepID=A0ABR2W3A7_9FUNG